MSTTFELLAAASNSSPRMVRFLQDLIAIPSPSGQEGAAVDRVLAEMRALGYDEVYRDAAGSAVGRIGSGPLTVLNDAHVDTVGAASLEHWRHPPFAGIVEDGVLYGLGASDDKGGLAALVHAGGLMQQLGLAEKITLYVFGAVQEEHCEGLALRYFLEQRGIRPDFVVSAEASDLKIVRGHRGRAEIVATSTGRTCHASMPHLGENALYKAVPFVAAVQAMSKHLPSDEFLGQATVVASRVETGPDSVNAVPDTCRVYLDRRLVPGETAESILAPLRDVAGSELCVEMPAYEGPSYTGLVLKGGSFFPAWSVPEASTLVQTAAAVVDAVMGCRPEVTKWPFSTDGAYSAGTLGIPTVGFGPGREEHAHTVDDQVPVDHLTICAAVYAALPGALAKVQLEAHHQGRTV